tara:strand:+ start:122 stop:634 length:513 start_codon:yes stop_codon:yes gene_type:complete
MLIKESELNSIKENKVTLITKFASLKNNYDFNFISNILEEDEIYTIQKTKFGNLKDVFQVLKVNESVKECQLYLDFFKKLLRYNQDEKDGVDLFFSLVSQVGLTHIDKEDVFIIGLKGKSIYRVFDVETIDYEINKNDLIFIPRGIKHKVIGMTPRIIMSVGFYGRRLNG